MQTTCDASALARAIRTVKPAMAKRGIMPVLNHIRLDADPGTGLTLTATDLESTAVARVPASVAEAGAAIVPAKELANVASGKGTVEFVSNGDELRAVNGLSSTIRSAPLDEWPRMKVSTWRGRQCLDLEALRSVLPAASKDDARPILSAVLFDEDGTLVATDSYRIHLVEGGCGGGARLLVPAKALSDAVKGATAATITHDGVGDDAPRNVRIATDVSTWTIRLTDGEYANYRPLIPTPADTGFTVDRPAFDHALKAIAAFLKPCAGAPVRIAPGDAPDTVRVHATLRDVGTKEATIAGSCSHMIAFNPEFLLELFAGIGADRMEAVDALRPGLVAWTDPAGRRHVRLLMPVRVS